MSERKKDKLPNDIDIIIKQLTQPNRQGSLQEIETRTNYVLHVRNNPTKSLSDTIEWLYEEINNLGGYVTDGITDNDINLIRQLFAELTKKNVINPKIKNCYR